MGELGGYRSLKSANPREILWSHESAEMHPGGVVLASGARDGNHSDPYEIRAGWALGRVTATGLYVPCKRTRLRSFASSGASSSDGDFTILPVDDASAFVVGDVVTVGNDVGLTITAIDYDSHLLTVDDGAFAVLDGDPVFAQDGSGRCVGFLAETVRVFDDDARTAVPRGAAMYVRGTFRRDMLLGDVSAILNDSGATLEGVKVYDTATGVYVR